MKFVKKASGTDVIPNKAFWVGLPSTLKVRHMLHGAIMLCILFYLFSGPNLILMMDC